MAGTQVRVKADEQGYVTQSIETIRPGDWVLARNQHDPLDGLDPRRVTELFAQTSDHVRVLSIQDSDGNIETIRTTDSHPFYVNGLGWTTAGELKIGQATWRTPPGSRNPGC